MHRRFNSSSIDRHPTVESFFQARVFCIRVNVNLYHLNLIVNLYQFGHIGCGE